MAEDLDLKNYKEVILTVHKEIRENADSIEIGSPSKGGAIKIYLDFNKPEEAKIKINQAKEIREYARTQLILD